MTVPESVADLVTDETASAGARIQSPAAPSNRRVKVNEAWWVEASDALCDVFSGEWSLANADESGTPGLLAWGAPLWDDADCVSKFSPRHKAPVHDPNSFLRHEQRQGGLVGTGRRWEGDHQQENEENGADDLTATCHLYHLPPEV